MTDFSKEELLSAYLDNELSAAERADVERLLASEPAARQALEELRALSDELRSLPRQSLGEDLSRQVLRTAERRMLTAEEPCGVETEAPTPLTYRERFLRPRTLVWLGLTAAVAVLILINERKNPIVVDRDREVAVVPAAPRNDQRRKPGPPPTIQARHEDQDFKHKEASERAPAAEVAASKSPAGDAPSMPAAGGTNSLAENYRSEPGPIVGDAPAPNAMKSLRGRTAKIAGSDAFSEQHQPASSTPSLNAKAAPVRSEAFAARAPQKAILVVHCSVTPEAAKSHAMQKLLSANGVDWRSAESDIAERSPRSAVADQMQSPGMSDEVAEKKEVAKKEVQRESDQPSIRVFGEVTDPQLQAVLAGLAAQPDKFVSVTIQSPHGQAVEIVVDSSRRASRQVLSGGAGSQRLTKQAPPSLREQTETAAGSPALPQSLVQSSPAAGPLPRQEGPTTSPRQKVLFVVRVVSEPVTASPESSPEALPAKAAPSNAR